MTQHFDINRIIGIEIWPSSKASYKWLPRKQKTWFFGLFKRNAWHSEGFYANGCYQECYESGCWDACPVSYDSLIERNYLIDEENVVWHRPYVKVFLEHECKVQRSFETLSAAEEWVDTLIKTSGKTFEIIRK